jgi:HD superfamily phosphohydrolase
MPFADLPELTSRHAAGGIRLPPGVTVPLTPRVRRLLDSPPLRRLAAVRQLGLVSLVYPGAVHSRLEHSLGVYRLAIDFLTSLQADERFSRQLSSNDAAAFLVAALVHDVGHWPYCHPIEDMGLTSIPRHESLVAKILAGSEIAPLLEADWGLSVERLDELIQGKATDPAGQIIHSLLSGPIDVDKMDYLARDSLHAGVPYGRHFDQERLLASLCLDESAAALAITDKGRTAAELMVFARYVMFSEVYWHHAVRSATAMLQRAVWLCRDRLDISRMTCSDDAGFVSLINEAANDATARQLLDGLFGPRRQLYKRVVAYDAGTHPDLHTTLAGQPYARLAAAADRLAAGLSRKTGLSIPAASLIIDAPPVEKEIEFRLQVRYRNEAASGYRWRPLAEVSPVTQSLAHRQFDCLVKQVRLFAPAGVSGVIQKQAGLEEMILEAGRSVVKEGRSQQL